MPIPNIDLSQVTGLRKNPVLPPRISTRSALFGGDRSSIPQPQGIIFQEDFNNQPDWHSGLEENNTGAFPVNGDGPDRTQTAGTHTIPHDWYSVRQDPTWAPSVGHPDRHEAIEILSANADKARGGVGKSFVSWRDCAEPEMRWNSDSMLLKYFPGGYNEIYFEFWIRFSPEMVAARSSSTSSKICRISSWSEEGSFFQTGSIGEQGPLFIWNWDPGKNHGVRNRFTPRGGPHGENYTMTEEELGNLPRGSMNFTTDTEGMGVNGKTPEIPDLINGGFIARDGTLIWHDQIFGPSENWTKMAFYLKMNSYPGVNDGICRQWLNDLQIHNNTTISWVNPVNGDSTFSMPKWNLVSIGGNDFFHDYPDSERREEWYAIDDIIIRDSIPENLI